MGSVKTSTKLIEGVKRRAMIPGDNATFNDADFLEIMNEELMLGLLSTILKVHQEFYVYTDEQTLSSGTTSYPISYRAIGSKLRNVSLKDGSGNIQQLTRVEPEDAGKFTNQGNTFYLKNDKVVFTSTPQSGTLQMDIFLRPNQLVATSRAATILSIDSDTGIITFSSNVPSHFASGIKYDFISKNAPCKTLAYDITASGKSNTTLTFTTTDIPDDLVVGDYITIAEETIVPQMPVEMIPILEQRAAIYCLESLGDFEAMKKAEDKLLKMEYNVNTLIDNRTEGNPQKANNTNSLLRRGSRRFSSNRGV